MLGDFSISLMILEYHPNCDKGSPIDDDNFATRTWIETLNQIVDSCMFGAHTIRTRWGSPKTGGDPLSVFGDISISLTILEYHPNCDRGPPKVGRDPLRCQGIP